MGREVELKYRAEEAVLTQLREKYGPGREIKMETTYFDTADAKLSDAHMTLRLRRENEETVCTLKTPLPDGSRGEWECPAADLKSGLSALLALGAPNLLRQLTADDLIPVCGARFTRVAIELPTADGMAELALDSGILLGGGRQIPLREVELELKSGSEEALFALAANFAAQWNLTAQPHSKYRRALDLAQGE